MHQIVLIDSAFNLSLLNLTLIQLNKIMNGDLDEKAPQILLLLFAGSDFESGIESDTSTDYKQSESDDSESGKRESDAMDIDEEDATGWIRCSHLLHVAQTALLYQSLFRKVCCSHFVHCLRNGSICSAYLALPGQMALSPLCLSALFTPSLPACMGCGLKMWE